MGSLAVLVAASLLLSVPQTAPTVDEEIKRQLVAYTDAFNRRDIRALLDFYEEDAIRVIPGAALRGREKIRAAEERVWAMEVKVRIVSFETQSLRVFGDVAEEVGLSILEALHPDGTKGSFKGRYLTLWHRGADGIWRVQSDASMPEAEPKAPAKNP